ncbi:MAG: ABC transporter substrate-binding protein [Clostridiales bacterium]|nr:ABC transporter substrate-binding protein [Clostridiales bacterium]
MKKLLSLVLALMMVFSMAAFADDNAPVRVSALMGPTGMGLVKLMKDSEGGNDYEFTLAASADLITPKFIKGELDVACVPANLASVLYNKTNGGVTVLAVNTLGVLYIVERGNAITSVEDLRGKTVYASGKGATPEYALNYLLTESGINPDTDLNLIYKAEHAECLTALIQDENAVAMLPQPFVTVAQTKANDIRIALDMTEEWNKLQEGKENPSGMLTGVVVARTEFVQNNPEKVEKLLNDYAASVNFVNENVEEGAKLIGEYGIVAEAVAKVAIPYCKIVCIQGEEMKTLLSGYLNVLAGQNPTAIGGKVPNDDFYYGVQ